MLAPPIRPVSPAEPSPPSPTALYAGARLAGVDFVGRFDASAPPQPLFALQPAIASLVPSLIGALLLLGMSKFLKRPATPFAILATVLTELSLGGAFNIPDAFLGTKVVLAAMHVVAAVAITIPLVREAQKS